MSAFANARRYVELTVAKQDLKTQLEAIEAALRGLEPKAVEEMLNEGLPRLPIDGRLLYFGRLITASTAGQDPKIMKRAFARVKLGDLVMAKPNIMGIKSHIRERLDAGLAVEPVITRFVQWRELRQLRCVKDSGEAAPTSLDEALGKGSL